jgi:sugar phosphate permease
VNPAAAPALDSRSSWRVLGGCGLAFVFGAPALFGSTFGLFMVPLQQSQGWSRGDIAFSLTLTTMVGWISVLLSGWLMDHVRLRPLVFVGVVLGAANLAAFSLIGAGIWAFYGLVVLLAFTTMGASPLALSKIVQGWFERKVGTALGILYACGAVGGVLHPLTITAVMASAGWRGAFLAIGAMALVGGLVAVVALIREPPPAAAVPVLTPVDAKAVGAMAPMIAFLGNGTWWKLAAWNFLFAAGTGFIMIHFAALLHDRGASAAQIGVAMSLVGASHFAGNLLAGWLVDRMSPRLMAALLMLLPLAAALLMLKGQSYPAMVVAASVLGLSSGSDGSLSAFLARHYFGGRLFGQAMATQMVALTLAGGLSPWLSGLLRDRSGDYDLSLTIAAAAFAAAAVAGWLLPSAGAAENRSDLAVA